MNLSLNRDWRRGSFARASLLLDLRKIILGISQFFAFLHSLGQSLSDCAFRDMSVRHPIADIESKGRRSTSPNSDIIRPATNSLLAASESSTFRQDFRP
jgi:hypothetical protein